MDLDYFNLVHAEELKDSVDFYHWRYDDGTEGGILIASEFYKRKVLDVRKFVSKERRKDFWRGIKKRGEKKGQDTDHEGIDITYGLKMRSKENRDFSRFEKFYRAEPASFDEFQKMLIACGQSDLAYAEVLRLVSGILAGYTTKLFADQIISDSLAEGLRAPVLLVKNGQYIWDILTLFIKALSAADEKHVFEDLIEIQSITPVKLPSVITSRDISADACLEFRKTKKKLPAQYRETTVLIDTRAYSKGQLYEFQRRNRWASIVLYNGTPDKSQISPVIIQPKILLDYRQDWDMDAVNDLVCDFVDFLASSEEVTGDGERHSLELEVSWREAEARIAEYQGQKKNKKLLPTEALYLCIQLATLHLLLHFCIASKNRLRYLWDEWSYLLLPGCCERPQNNLPLEQRTIITEKDYQEVFEQVMSRMLDMKNLDHILVVPAKSLFDRTDPERPEFEYWGYLRQYKAYRSNPEFLALQFDEKRFIRFASDFCPAHINMKDVVSYIRKNPPAYLHHTKQANMPKDLLDKERYYCITLCVDDLTFLDETIRTELQTRIQFTK